MLARLVFFAALGFASLAACGGGGGGGGGGSPSTATPSTPNPTNTNQRPSAVGDTFSYAGTSTTSFVRPPQTNGALPSPNPSSTQTLSYTTTQTQTVGTTSAYNGVVNPVAFTTSESDTLAGGLATTTTQSTEYYSFVAAGSTTSIHDLGGSSSNSNGDTVVTLVGPNNGLVDVLPEAAGSLSVVNDATFQRSETTADGTKTVRKTNADGTYTESGNYTDGTTTLASVNADGSGAYGFPTGGASNSTFSVAAPAPGATAGAGTIAISISYAVGTPGVTATPLAVSRSVAVWYPQPPILSKQTVVDSGATAIPSSCNVTSSLVHGNANAIVATASTVDPLFGELETRTATQYTEPGVGVACVVLQDVLQQFYDFSQQTGQIVVTRSTPVQTTTTTQTLGLTAENVIGLTSVAQRVPAIAAARAHFAALLDRRRAERHATAARTLRASIAIGSGVRQ